MNVYYNEAELSKLKDSERAHHFIIFHRVVPENGFPEGML